MTAFSLSVEVRSAVPLTAGNVTDLVEAVVDELDVCGYKPSVSAAGIGSVVVLTVAFDVHDTDDLIGVRDATAAVVSALHAAGVGGGGSLLAGAQTITTGQLQDA